LLSFWVNSYCHIEKDEKGKGHDKIVLRGLEWEI
jgi:hypothetical protein